MKNYQLIILLCFSLIFSFCKNDELPMVELDYPDLAAITNSYSLLTPGNYWIYQQYTGNGEGEMEPETRIDSVYVEKDTMINDLVFSKLISNDWGLSTIQFLRIDDENLVDDLGVVQFSWAHIGDLLNSVPIGGGVGVFNSYMSGERSVQTTLGTFDAFKKEIQPVFTNPSSVHDCGYLPHEYWVKDIGIIRKEAHFVGGCRRIRRELVRYHIN